MATLNKKLRASVVSSGDLGRSAPKGVRGGIAQRRAFTFIEVLFAVIILGIGFIMIAAMFPVAMEQSRSTADDTAGVAVAQYTIKAVSYISFSQSGYSGLLSEKDLAIPNVNNTYPNGIGKVFSFNDPRFAGKLNVWPLIQGNLIYPSNSADGAALLYRRDIPASAIQSNNNNPPSNTSPALPTPTNGPASFAEIFAIACACRNRSTYVNYNASNPTAASDVTPNPSGGNATLDPLLFNTVTFRTTTDPSTGLGVDVADFSNAQPYSHNNQDLQAIAEGAIVVISDDTSSGYPTGCYGWSNGMMFKLGTYAPEIGAKVWRLAPSTPLSKYAWPGLASGSTPPNGIQQAAVFIVGRGWSSPSRYSSGGEYDGRAQEIGYATGIVPTP